MSTARSTSSSSVPAFARLACAHDLLDAGVECSVLEVSDGIGGRVRIDTVHGFLLNGASRSCSPPIQSVHRRVDVDKPELLLRVRREGERG